MHGPYTARFYMKFDGVNYTEITSDVLQNPKPVLSFGIRQPSITSFVAEPGTATFALDNSALNSGSVAGYYSLFHASKRTGFDYHVITKVTITKSGGVEQPVFVGRIVDIDVVPGKKLERSTSITVGDPMWTLAETYVKGVTLQTNKRADQLLTTLLAASSDADYGVLYSTSFTTGINSYPYALDLQQDNKTTLREAINKICASERAHAYFVTDITGTFLRFQNRLQDTQNTQPTGVTLTFNDTMTDLAVDNSRDNVIQRVQTTAYATIVDTGASTVIYSLQTTTTLIQPGEVNTALFGPFRDPNNPGTNIGALNQVNPVATTDYLMNANSDGSGADLTANFTVTASFTSAGVAFTITNNGTTAGYVTFLRVRGDGTYRRPVVIASTQAGSSYGIRTTAVEMPYMNNLALAQDMVTAISDTFGDPLVPRVQSVSFWGSKLTSTLDLSFAGGSAIGTMVSLKETQTGTNWPSLIVRGADLELYAGEGDIRATYHLEPSDVSTWTSVTYDAANFTTAVGTWTVDAADVKNFSYMITGTIMVVAFSLVTTSLSTGGGVSLNLKLPIGKVAGSKDYFSLCYYNNNGTRGVGLAKAVATVNQVSCYLVTETPWAAAVNTTDVHGIIAFEYAWS